MATAVKPIIYQLVLRYFGNTNRTNRPAGSLAENGCGTFADVSDAALASLHGLGVTHVWLTGALRQATLTDYPAIGLPADDADVVKGVAGSFYAVRDYFDVCPDYAVEPANRLAEFKALVDRVHAAGMKVMIDFIPNHVARGYQSVVRPDLNFGDDDDTSQFFSPQNHFFYVTAYHGQPGHPQHAGEPLRLSRPPHWNPPGYAFDGLFAREDGMPQRPVKVTGDNCVSTDPGPNPWYETIKLNYGYDFVNRTAHYDPRPRTWDLADKILEYWQGFGVDGFRCDFAHYVPAEAWQFLIDRCRARDPHVYFIAEAYPYDGSGDPVTHRKQLIDAGFHGVYNDGSYNALKRIYLDWDSQDAYHHAIGELTPQIRHGMVQYLENHDERRVASSMIGGDGLAECGFGTADAGYLVGPLQYLCGAGPVLFLNGQEVGEPGGGDCGFARHNGRTSLFDYWAMPEFAKWVNGHAYDGAPLADWQHKLRAFYGGLFHVCQDSAVLADGYWGLKYYNRPDRFADCPDAFYTFARYEAGRLLLIVANFDRQHEQVGRVRLPQELLDAAGVRGAIDVRLRLDRDGAKDQLVGQSDADALVVDGIELRIAAQTTHAYEVGKRVVS